MTSVTNGLMCGLTLGFLVTREPSVDAVSASEPVKTSISRSTPICRAPEHFSELRKA